MGMPRNRRTKNSSQGGSINVGQIGAKGIQDHRMPVFALLEEGMACVPYPYAEVSRSKLRYC